MTLRKVSVVMPHADLTCDVCGSTDIHETTEGYVCRDCAVVLDIQKLQYHRPYNTDVIQYAKGLGKTQIGSKRERIISSQSRTLKRLNRYNSQLSGQERVEQKARQEIRRILARLDLSTTCEAFIMEKFRKVREKLAVGTKFRSAEKLASILTFIGLKLENIAINSRDIIKISSLTLSDFRSFFTQIAHHIPEYAARDRQEYISQKLLDVTEYFGLEMAFYFLTKKILHKLWEAIKNTKDNVIAGLCASIIALCNYREEINVSSICEFFGIRMSTIQFQVKNRIFKEYHIPGFSSLVRSSGVLKQFMGRIGIFESEKDIVIEQDEDNGIIEIQLGNAQQTFNPLNDHYLFGITDEADDTSTITIGYLEVFRQHRTQKPSTQEEASLWFELILGNYHSGKGPPGVG